MGWIFIIVSWVSIITLGIFCFYKVFTPDPKDPDKYVHG